MTRSASSSRAVIMMIGVSTRARSCRQTSKPSPPGSMTSSKITSGCSRRMVATPSRASKARVTRTPCDSKYRAVRRASFSSSSTYTIEVTRSSEGTMGDEPSIATGRGTTSSRPSTTCPRGSLDEDLAAGDAGPARGLEDHLARPAHRERVAEAAGALAAEGGRAAARALSQRHHGERGLLQDELDVELLNGAGARGDHRVTFVGLDGDRLLQTLALRELAGKGL